MKCIILAAGKGSRLSEYTKDKPKCLLEYNNESIIKRLIKQLKKYNIDTRIVVGYKKELIKKEVSGVEFVDNDKYSSDKNILSFYLGTKDMDDDILLLEADMICEDKLIEYVTGTDFENKNVWFVDDNKKKLPGGYLETDKHNRIIDIHVGSYFPYMKDRYKSIGIMRFCKKDLPRLRELIEEKLYNKRIYFFEPWKKHLCEIKLEIGDVSAYQYGMFNTPKEYQDSMYKQYNISPINKNIIYLNVKDLKGLEDIDEKRLPVIEENTIVNNKWIEPLIVERNTNIVIDGNHKLALSRNKNLKRVPCILFDYDEIKIWSLREDYKLDKEYVLRYINKGYKFPYKTVKHKLPNITYECNIDIERLK